MRRIIYLSIVILIAFGIVLFFLEQSHTKNSKVEQKSEIKISGVVVPHHNIVSKQRSELFIDLKNKIKTDNYPDTIILVSPNHYYAGQGKIQTTNQEWELKDSTIKPNAEVINRLIKTQLVVNDPTSFIYEHGIYNILDDIKTTFPDSKIVPLILQKVDLEELNKLESILNQSCSKCLMVTSVDFSHYQPAQLADLHDEKSLKALKDLNTQDLLENIEVDSGSSLALFALWANNHETKKFVLKNHTNSDLLLNNPDMEGTSHIFGWYESGEKDISDDSISFVVSNKENFGEENRSLWGTDILIKESVSDQIDLNTNIIAGTITNEKLYFFILPIDPTNSNKLLTGIDKKKKIETIFLNLSMSMQSNNLGAFGSVTFDKKISIKNLSNEQIQSKIKLTINIKQ